jgi:RNA 3'-terminal phosphate cyclase (ATP)
VKKPVIILDGSQGEGGGQIVRSAVTLSCITGQAVRVEKVRAGRKTGGLRPQHVAAVRAAAELCDAEIEGVAVGSTAITFEPRAAVRAGVYEWTVGTAGSATLVLQTVLLPLALAEGRSELRVHGGTHVPRSPSGHYLRDVYAPALLELGADAEIYGNGYGWTPQGGGTLSAYTGGGARLCGVDGHERGQLERVFGVAVGCNLPAHIPQRMANRARNLLAPHLLGVTVDIRPQRVRSVSTGAGIFLAAEYGNGRGGVGVLGRRGMPSEVVAERAVQALLAFHDSGAAVDRHLADQLIMPLALAEGPSVLHVEAITSHCRTQAAVVRAFLPRGIHLDEHTQTITIEAT